MEEKKGGTHSSDSSITSTQLGMTLCPKMQAVVKEVLKEVSTQHNRAIKEQHGCSTCELS
jgi:hypothetical protein